MAVFITIQMIYLKQNFSFIQMDSFDPFSPFSQNDTSHKAKTLFKSRFDLQYKMLDLLWWLVMFMVPPFAVAMAILNIKKKISSKEKRKWAFFHPFCNDGGGGEKVLWCMVKELTERTGDEIAIYSLESDKEAILQKIKSRFGITILPEKFQIVHVAGRQLLTSKGFLTMVLHILLPMVYAFKCLWKYQPDIFYDTTGYASSLVLVKLMLPMTTTAAYVHYPFISEEMIEKVREKRVDFNNSSVISRSPFLSKAKLVYYIIVLKIYKLIGKAVDFAQTNSSWTHNHMSNLWPQLEKKGKLIKLYPPCTVKPLLQIKKPDCSKIIQMMSLAQFRPEKQQHLQLYALSELMKLNLKKKIVLKICGTTRGADDEAILQDLKNTAKELKIEQNVEFIVNQSFSKIIECFQESSVGIHTMQAEHFGISVVEMLAAGLIVVAHNSAGPKFDIIKDQQFLASTKESYIDKLKAILISSDEKMLQISKNNRKKALEFGEEEFQKNFLESIESMNKQV